MFAMRRGFRWWFVVLAFAGYMTIPTAALADDGGTPSATVTPHLELDPDSPVIVTVAATGVPASTEMNVMECLPNNCFQLANPTSTADGTLSIQVSVQWSYGPSSTECNWDDAGAFCYVRVFYVNPIPGGDDILVDSIELTYAGHDSRTVNRPASCTAMSIIVDEDNVSSGSIDCTDPDGDSLFGSLMTAPAHGNVGFGPNGAYLYTPDPDYHGTDGFTYVAFDGTENSALATATIEVTAVNDPPSCPPVALSTRPGQAISGTLACSDADGDALIYSKLTDIRGSTWTLASNGTFTFVPSKSLVGTVVLAYRASDGQAATDGSISFTMMANRAPVCEARLISGPMNRPVSGTMTCTDADGDVLAYAPVTKVRIGSWSLASNGAFTFTPGTGFSGDVVLTYRASDGTATTSGTITFRIVNAAPTCPAVALTSPRGTTVTGTLACTDPDGSQLTYSLSKLKVRNGRLTISANGSFTFVPTASFVGTQVVPFNVSDGTSTVSGSITLTFN